MTKPGYVHSTASDLGLAALNARESTERRDALICQARAEGMTYRAIGAAASLSHTAVAKIVARS